MSTGVPQDVQNWRWLASVFLTSPSFSSPFTTRTLAAGHSVAAGIGAPSQPRHELQWQYTWTEGSPLSSTWTAPQKQWLSRFSLAIENPPSRFFERLS